MYIEHVAMSFLQAICLFIWKSYNIRTRVPGNDFYYSCYSSMNCCSSCSNTGFWIFNTMILSSASCGKIFWIFRRSVQIKKQNMLIATAPKQNMKDDKPTIRALLSCIEELCCIFDSLIRCLFRKNFDWLYRYPVVDRPGTRNFSQCFDRRQIIETVKQQLEI